MAFKIGGEFGLRGNARKFLGDVGNALGMLERKSNQVGSVLKKTETGILDSQKSLLKQAQSARRAGLGLDEYKSRLQASRESALKAGVAADHLADSYLNAAGKLVTARGRLVQTGEAAKKVGSETLRAGEKGQRAGGLLAQGARVAQGAWQRTGDLLKSVFNLPNALMAGLTTGVVGVAGKSILDAVGYKEQQMISFNTMLGDTGKALKLYKWALKEADATPFETPDILNATKAMLSYGFTLREIPTLMRKFSDTSSGLSLGADGLERLTNIFGQIRSKGKLQGDELLQLNQMGLGASKILKNAWKGQNFEKLLEGGKINAEDAIGVLLDGMKKFDKLGEQQAKSIFGLVSTLKSRPFNLFQSLDADKELKPVKNVLNNLIAITDFDNNKTGKKIRSRFTSSMNSLFGGVFGSLAKTTNPEQVGKTLDKIFDRIDNTLAWFKNEGPGILSSAKSFFAGIGTAINTIKQPLDWLNGAMGGNLLKGLGILAGGALVVKGANTLLGGLPEKFLGGAGGLLGGAGVQKVFVVNMGAGLGGGLPDVGGLGGGLWQRTKTVFGRLGGWVGRVGAGGVTLLSGAARGVLAVTKTVGSGLIGLAARGGGALLGMTGVFVTRVAGLAGTIGSSLLALGSGIALRFTTLLGTFGTGITALGARLTTGLAGLSGSILGKLGAAAAAFGVGWAVGTQISSIKTGKNPDGTNRTVGSEVRDTLGNMFFNRDAQQGQLIKDQAEIAKLKAQIARNRALGLQNGQAVGQGIQQGLANSRGAATGAGKNLGNAINNGVRGSLQIKSPSRVALKAGQFYGQGLEMGLRQQVTPVARAAAVLAAAVAVSMAQPTPQTTASARPPNFATAKSQDRLSAANLPPIGAVATRATPTIQITNHFGDINVMGADAATARSVGAEIYEQARIGAEQGLLEAFEKLAAQIGGVG